MTSFYLVAGFLALAAAVLLVRPLLAGRREALGRDAHDAQVFRDQLEEIERDLARGTITPVEAEGARVEVSRRLIAAAERARTATAPQPAPQGNSGLAAGLALVGAPALAVAIYLGVGAPGTPDQPLSRRGTATAALLEGQQSAARPSQAEAEEQVAGRVAPPPAELDPDHVELIERLEAKVAERPNDPEGLRLLANSFMQIGRWGDAWRSYERLVEVLGQDAGADIHASMAEGMILAAGGYVSPDAEAALARALEIDPSLPVARYYAGLALRQSGRLNEAIALWERLRRESPSGAPYLPWLDQMLAEARTARGDALSGPTEEDIVAAERLSASERAQMVEGMVSRLDERLSRQGGSLDEWGRLIASYATLGRPEEARQALRRALAALDGPQADAIIAHAASLGLSVDDAAAAVPSAPGPTREQVDAASEMSPDDRMAMIESMVARLEERLTSDGGTAEEWLRLIRSYVQLDRRGEAARVYALATEALAGDPALGFVKEQALLLGLPVE